ncbi:hypothetical protein D6C87_04364 [Aureobasidium pullulans]|uniref:Aminoglycoside phosphotransferase domain-containing protein n=1 Tax=Aureobasidium pullulans TaxID=5580 RepID=A0AB38M4R7_AURPU|nr:hypothetical protein D6C94_03074 [Aureobasidium pullulans]THZ43341.1 hypothetical protein D6C87_04364 [Aureobasidium pullulans]
MDEDDLNKDHQHATNTWAKHFLDEYGDQGVEKLASSYREGQRCRWELKKNGSFNSCHKVVFEDGTAWAVRFPIPGRVMHPDEKIRREVAVMRFVKEKTKILLPKVIAFGTAADNHDPSIGPFLITEWVEGIPVTSLIEELPRPSWGPVLRHEIEDNLLRKIYRQMANILLELAEHDFDKIGALSMTEGDDALPSWSIDHRPMTMKMNDVEAGSNVIVDDHTLPPFETTTDYMQHLVQQNITHLHKQRNSIDDAADARRKFILRCRIEALVPYFTSKTHESGPFKLFCDDFRFGNVLIDEDTLEFTGVIDWEWTYTAPHQFLFSAPPWLILERPTSWTKNGESRYKDNFTVFLQCLGEEEEKRQSQSSFAPPEDKRMSTLMRQSLDDGTFWLTQLVQEAFSFDEEILWRNLEKAVHRRGLLEVGVPSEEDVEKFVETKLMELDQYNLDLSMLER